MRNDHTNADRRRDIYLSGLVKHFKREGGARVNAIDHLDLQIPAGQFTVLVGPSGCGKTTLLRCLAGLERPELGEIKLGASAVYSSERRLDIPPEERKIAMLFQSYALWPHMTVFENVAYPLKASGCSRREIRRRVLDMLEKVQCQALETQYPNQISGGQQQRVALARALVGGQDIVLFDEPLSNIDARVRDQLRLEILRIQQAVGFTAVYVTHDQLEALTLADQIVVLREGKIAQAGTPREVYDTPSCGYVARFMGALNELDLISVQSEDNGRLIFETCLGLLTGDGPLKGDATLLCFRPSKCNIYAAKPNITSNLFEAELQATLFLGSHFEFVVRRGGKDLRIWQNESLPVQAGARVWIHVPESSLLVLD